MDNEMQHKEENPSKDSHDKSRANEEDDGERGSLSETSSRSSRQQEIPISKARKPAVRRKPCVKRGRVTKRRPPARRRRVSRPNRGVHRARTTAGPRTSRAARGHMRRTNIRRTRARSTDTECTKMSSESDSDAPAHHSHHRQYGNRRLEQRREERKHLVETVIRKIKLRMKRGLPFNVNTKSDLPRRTVGTPMISVQTQQGSRAKILSSLCKNTNAMEVQEAGDDEPVCMKVTPEMIYQSLRLLSPGFPRDYVPFKKIVEHILSNWPVTQNIAEVTEELNEKLKIAQQIDMVEFKIIKNRLGNPTPHWRLRDKLLKRVDTELSKTHIIRFWILYGDTMKPVHPKKSETGENKSVLDLGEAFDKKGKGSIESSLPCCSKNLYF